MCAHARIICKSGLSSAASTSAAYTGLALHSPAALQFPGSVPAHTASPLRLWKLCFIWINSKFDPTWKLVSRKTRNRMTWKSRNWDLTLLCQGHGGYGCSPPGFCSVQDFSSYIHSPLFSPPLRLHVLLGQIRKCKQPRGGYRILHFQKRKWLGGLIFCLLNFLTCNSHIPYAVYILHMCFLN